MVRRHRWVWILLFVAVLALLAVLATGWNVVLVHNYNEVFELTRRASRQIPTFPVPHLILGTLGFAAAVALLVTLFLKLLKEMRNNQLQTEFLAAVSHELKTPIATMELAAS